jgi:hypothetical protein
MLTMCMAIYREDAVVHNLFIEVLEIFFSVNNSNESKKPLSIVKRGIFPSIMRYLSLVSFLNFSMSFLYGSPPSFFLSAFFCKIYY